MANTLCSIFITAYVANDVYFNEKGSTPVARFRLLHNPYGKNAEGKENPPIAVNCVAFGGLAKVANDYVKKGNLLSVTGSLVKIAPAMKDGKEVRTSQTQELIIDTEIQVRELMLIGGKKDEKSNGSATTSVAPDEAIAGAPF